MHSIVLACVMIFFKQPLLKNEPDVAPLALDIRTFTVIEPHPEKIEEEPVKKIEQTPTPKPTPKVIKKQVIAQVKVPVKKPEVLNVEEEKTLLPDTPVQAPVNIIEPLHVSPKTNQQELITNAIQQAILRYKQYPKRAQRAEMQGTVVVGFSWSSLGLANLKVLKPSQYALLNEYCLELIAHASKDFPKVEQAVDITIPIGFELL